MRFKTLYESLYDPKIKKLTDYNGFEVWQVDGKMIRDNMEEEFTNFCQPLRFPNLGMSDNEFWIDKEESDDEAHFFCIHMFREYQEMKAGKTYEEAVELAEQEEKKARDMDEGGIKKYKGKIDIETIHKSLYGECSNGVSIWIIDGELVRDKFYVDFTAGGHHFVYSWCPIDEVWLDNDNHPKEQDLILLHELHERNLMAKGMGYNEAHKDSSRIEYECRKTPMLLSVYLQTEGFEKYSK